MKSTKEQFNLKDKVIVITGGGGLLGRKHAEAVAEFGATPILLDINEEAAQAVAADVSELHGVAAEGMRVDITDRASVEQACNGLLEKYGHIDGLINNAANDPKVKDEPGQKPWSRFEQFPSEVWEKDIAVGLYGAVVCAQVFGAEMKKQGKGVVLNIASDLGVIAPDQRIYEKEGREKDMQPVKPVTYSVVKHGLVGLTKYLATYWAQDGIRVNAISPGGVYNNHPEDFMNKLTNLIPLGRMADIDEYKGIIVFMMSDASSYMTGANVNIDGGRTCW